MDDQAKDGLLAALFPRDGLPKIVGNAIKISLVVGTALNLINQGEYLLAGEGMMVGNALLNYLVPFCVACYSGARALPIHESGRQPPHDENR